MDKENDDRLAFSSAIDNCILLPRKILDYVNSATANELRVMIYLCANGGQIEPKEICENLQIEPEELDNALSYWRGAKLITPTKNNKKVISKSNNPTTKASKPSKVSTMQIYEPELLAKKVDDDHRFRMLVNHVAQRFEKGTLNKNDINSLFYLYDYISIPAELICGIVEYCVENNRKSMNYLVKTAINLFEEQEINTYEKLENYLSARRVYNDNSSRFRRLAGIADRGLTSKEKATFSLWFEERKYPFDMVEYAYEITVDKLQKYNLNYVNAILDRWYSEGITTLAQAKENVESYKQSHKKFDNDTYDFDDFFNAALKRK